MSPLGKLFRKNKDDPDPKEEETEAEGIPQVFQQVAPGPGAQAPDAQTPEAAADQQDQAGDGAAEQTEASDPLAQAQEQQEQEQGKDQEELLSLFGTTAHDVGEIGTLLEEIEDVPIQELVAELRTVAAALADRGQSLSDAEIERAA